MQNLHIAFSPELPIWLASVFCVALAIFCLYGIYKQTRGSFFRLMAGILLGFSLFNPAILKEDRSPLKTIVPLIIDETTSQKFGNRSEQTSAAVEEVRNRFSKLENFELRILRTGDQISQTSDVSSALFTTLDTALQDVPADQTGGAIFITDGQVHDIPQEVGQSGIPGPLHVLLTGSNNEKDRRIVLKNAPRFGVVGESQELVYAVEETGFGNTPSRVKVTISLDGETITVDEVQTGEENTFVFDVPHGGKNIIELKAEVAPDEITDINNRSFATINGIRENLRVLLVSGEPHAGERTWRNLLKSDASVDLVHFTILRPPEKQDGTPITQLSLIAFPTRELFIQKIEEFDLIIFDRYKRRGVLPVLYFDNIARYVRNGGAVLVAAGPEYAEPASIAATPLNVILPAIADGRIVENPFTPLVSENGLKHPVTRKLDGWRKDKPQWARWFRTIGVQDNDAESVITNENGAPILMLERQGEGRVALFLSDHVWLWARGFEGGGPHVQLLRRLAHWLMKEPELDEERLTAQTKGKTLTITRQTLGDTPDNVDITTPSGEVLSLPFEPVDDGLWQAETDVDQIGLYRSDNETLTALAQVGPANPRELAAVTSTDALLKSIVDATSGSISRLSSLADAPIQLPRIVSVSENATSSGRGWIGLIDRDASILNGVFRIPLFSGLLGLALLLFGLATMWFREGR